MTEYLRRLPLFIGLMALALLAALVLYIEETAARLYWRKYARLKMGRVHDA